MGKPFHTTLKLPDSEAVTRQNIVVLILSQRFNARSLPYCLLVPGGANLILLRVQFILPIIPYYGQNNNTLLQLQERP